MKKIIAICLSFLLSFSLVGAFGSVSAEAVLYGDVNSDGAVDMKDLLFFRRWEAKQEYYLKNINKINADINMDGKRTVIDIMLLVKHLTKERVISNPISYTLSEENVSLCGRAVLEGGEVKLSQTASGFRFKADFAGDVQVIVSTEDNGKLVVTADEDYDNAVTVDVVKTKSKYLVELGLEKGEHTIMVQKATEWAQNKLITVSGVGFEGEFSAEKPAEKAHRIEFYGDSITSGYGNLSDNTESGWKGTWQYQDGTKTYASFTANALNADYAVASASGHGILGGHSDFTSVYNNFFDYSLMNDSKTLWSRADYNADLIVMNYGSNDAERVKKQISGSLQPAFDKEKFATDFEAECSKIIEGMRAENPDVEILWILGMNYVADDSPVVTSLKKLAQKYDYVNFYKCPPKNSGGDWHPTVAEHKYHSENLLKEINRLYPDMFK